MAGFYGKYAPWSLRPYLLSSAQQLIILFYLYRKIPWRLSKFQKARQRKRLRAVDSVVATLHSALSKQGQTLEALERWKTEMPTEQEMLPKDKYTIFDRKEKRYRKAIHSMLPLSASEQSFL